jgi:hypothetical protein
VVLVNARDAKNVPGRKTDVNDAQWLQKLHSYLRQRERPLESAASHIQHMQKALTLMNVQLHQVVEDVTGTTSKKIIRAIVAGKRNADSLAQYRDVRCKASVETVRDSLVGHHQAGACI